MCWSKTVAKFLYGVIHYLHEENRSWFTSSKHFSKRMNEHFGLCSQWKSRCLETLMQLDATIDDVTATANQIYHISAWQSQWRHRLWRRELHMNLSRVSFALCGPRCLVPRPHYSHGQSVSGRVVQAKWIDREGLGKRRSGTRQRSRYIHVHFSRNTNFDKIIISLLGWLIIEVKVTDNDKKNCTKFPWYLNFHQNLRSPHHLTSVGKSPELS